MAEYLQPKGIPADHKDLIEDVSYDFYGRRIATCSLDQNVKVWDMDETNEWKCTSSWKAHSGSIWRVSWAHPEFGQVLATCSFDRTVIIWEEQAGEDTTGSPHWIKRASLVDSRTSVNDVKFAPRHIGLQLATCSTDGQLRIYEAPDVMNLSQWSTLFTVSCKTGTSCLSWNPSIVHPSMIVVGSDDPQAQTSAVQVFEHSEQARKWHKLQNLVGVYGPVRDIAFAPNPGRSYHLLAVAAKELYILKLTPLREGGETKLDVRQPAQFDEAHSLQVWRVAWNATGTVLASSGDDGSVKLWKDNYMGNWSLCGVLQGADSATFGRSVAVGAPPGLKQPPAPTQHQVTDNSQRHSNTEKLLREMSNL